jgi:aspartyl-tRNA(Asn)/glutamyl-tRNA(Gln) amidotransferase subunit B
MPWETVIGLEIHTQLATQSKIFSGAATNFGAEPNTQAALIDLGMPGVLPVLNQTAVQMAVRFGCAIGAEIAPCSVFARKHYFYPDLPKGYQISQLELPVVGKGYVYLVSETGDKKTIGVTRAHLEEDAGKSLHGAFSGMSGIDLNRAGTPLLEIVSEPDMRSAEEAVAYARKIHQIVTCIGICDGNLQEGSFRCDANVSVRPLGQAQLGTRTELKNINSFRFLQKAIQFEAERQIDILEDGGRIVQETRLYDADRDETRSMRSKEEANDYRYFPDPDLLPLVIDADFIAAATVDMPELPDARAARFQAECGVSAYIADSLTSSRALADFFESVATTCGDTTLAANWVLGEFSAALNKADLTLAEAPVTADALAGLLRRIQDQTISGKIAKQVFAAMWQGEGSADTVIAARGLKQVTDTSALTAWVDEVIAASPQQVANYQSAAAEKRPKMIGFFVGQVMKKSKGQANPQQVNQLLQARLCQ